VPSISAAGFPEPRQPLLDAYELIQGLLRDSGVEEPASLELPDTGPVITGEIPAPEGAPTVLLYLLGLQRFKIEADAPIPTGTHQVRMEFAYDGGGLAKGGDVTFYYDGQPAGTGRVEQTQPMIFSADETTDIGYESGTTVTPDYSARTSRFTGKIHWVRIDLGDDSHSHTIDPEEKLRVAMARQ
jgi:arylsulfatase